MAKIEEVRLAIVTVRNPRAEGAEVPVDEILSGETAVPVRAKVRLDSNGLDEEGEGVPAEDAAAPTEIKWHCQYDGAPDLIFDGSGRILQPGSHWALRDQGVNQLAESKGHTVVIQLLQGVSGTTDAQIYCTHRGVTSNALRFRAD